VRHKTKGADDEICNYASASIESRQFDHFAPLLTMRFGPPFYLQGRTYTNTQFEAAVIDIQK
jgi:hypothetical protein